MTCLKQRDGKTRADIERKFVQKRATPAVICVRDFVPPNVKSHFSFLDSGLSIPESDIEMVVIARFAVTKTVRPSSASLERTSLRQSPAEAAAVPVR